METKGMLFAPCLRSYLILFIKDLKPATIAGLQVFLLTTPQPLAIKRVSLPKSIHEIFTVTFLFFLFCTNNKRTGFAGGKGFYHERWFAGIRAGVYAHK